MGHRKHPDTLWRLSRDAGVGFRFYESNVSAEGKGRSLTVLSNICLKNCTEIQLRYAPSDQILQAATEHYKAHEAQYHDLAVLLAYMQGVEIELQQPIVVGRPIEAIPLNHQQA